MGYRFIHAADIHLDSPLKGIGAYEDAPAEKLRKASRDALKELVTKAIEDHVSFVVFAGDLYDGNWRDYNTGIFFAAQMGRLAKAGIRAFVLYGNHDAENEMTKKLALPDNVTVFSSRAPQVHKLDDLKVALHGQSFADRAVNENLAANYKSKVADHFNIGVLHTALEGYAAHANYAPCTVDELHAKGYDYWALGHVHEYQKWEGPSTIVFPGNLQGRHVREAGRKGAVTITVDDFGRSRVERLYVDVLRWEILKVDASHCSTLEDIARRVGHGLQKLLVDADVPRAVRVVLEGTPRLQGALFGNAAGVRAEVLAQAAAIDPEQLWIEKVRFATASLVTPNRSEERHEAYVELHALFDEASQDSDFLRGLQEELRPFLNKVSDDLREDVPLLELARREQFADLIREVAPALLAQLETKAA